MSYGGVKLLKTIEMSELDLVFTIKDIYINSNLDYSQNSAEAAEVPRLRLSYHEHFSNDQKDHLNTHENSYELYNEKGHFFGV